MAVTNAFLVSRFSFPAESEFSRMTTKQFCNALAFQLWHYPFPDIVTPGRNVPLIGAAIPQWFETIPGRFDPTDASNSSLNSSIDGLSASELDDPILRNGWTVKVPAKQVEKPVGAPGLPIDLLLAHKQQKIRFRKENRKRHQCKMCKKHGLKQKKPSFQCIECGGFYCHDIEQGARGCFWAHMCDEFLGSGMPTATWRNNFKHWEEKRVKKCKALDCATN
jgi:hypothetical protein